MKITNSRNQTSLFTVRLRRTGVKRLSAVSQPRLYEA